MLRVNLPLYWKLIVNSQRRDPKYGMNSVSGDHFMKGHTLVFLSRLFFRVRSGNSIISPFFLLLMTKRCRNWVRGNEMISPGRRGARICWIEVLNFRSHLSLSLWLLPTLHCFVSRRRGLVPSQDRKARAEPYSWERHRLQLMKDSIPGLWEGVTANTFLIPWGGGTLNILSMRFGRCELISVKPPRSSPSSIIRAAFLS